MLEDTLKSARQDRQEGKLWRAKQRLQGAFGSHNYTPELLAEYASVLFAMQDYLEAGRYYFWSGIRTEEALEAIAMFREHSARTGNALLSSRPRHVPQPFKAPRVIPDLIRQELLDAGLKVPRKPKRKEAIHILQPAYGPHMSAQGKRTPSFARPWRMFQTMLKSIIYAIFVMGLLSASLFGLSLLISGHFFVRID